MPTYTELFHKETLNQTYWTWFKTTMFSVLSEERFILSWSIFVSGVSDPSFSTSSKVSHQLWIQGRTPNFQRPLPPQWSQEGAFLKPWPLCCGDRSGFVPSLPEPKAQAIIAQRCILHGRAAPFAPPATSHSTKPAENTLWHWESSPLNKAIAPGKAATSCTVLWWLQGHCSWTGQGPHSFPLHWCAGRVTGTLQQTSLAISLGMQCFQGWNSLPEGLSLKILQDQAVTTQPSCPVAV